MFPFDHNGVKPFKEGAYESWHQVVTVPSTQAPNPEIGYNWGCIDALFDQQTQVVPFNPRIKVPSANASPSKPKKCRVLGKIKLKRLVTPRTGVKRLVIPRIAVKRLAMTSQWKAIMSQKKRTSRRLRKRGTPIAGILQKVKKRLKKRQLKLRQKMQNRRSFHTQT